MKEVHAPYRTDIIRTSNQFDDLAKEVVATFRTYSDIEGFVAPLVSRNADSGVFTVSKDCLKEHVKNKYGMHSIMYLRMLDSIEKFYSKHKATRRLPNPHIISHRSAHFGEGLFDIVPYSVEEYLAKMPTRSRNYKVTSVHKVEVAGLEPFFIENMRKGDFKYLMLRPKLGKSGGPQFDKWEILLYNMNFGYNVEHIDTEKNPRYNGTI